MTAKRTLFVVAGLVVCALAGGLLFLLGRPSSSTGERPAPAAGAASTSAAASSVALPGAAPPASTGPTGPAATASGRGASEVPTTVTDDGRVVRDHRGRDDGRPPTPRLLPSLTLESIRNAVLSQVKRCGAPLRSAGKSGRVQVLYTAAAAGGELRITDVQVTSLGFEDEAVTSCVRDAYLAISLEPSPHQVDGEQKVVTVFDLP